MSLGRVPRWRTASDLVISVFVMSNAHLVTALLTARWFESYPLACLYAPRGRLARTMVPVLEAEIARRQTMTRSADPRQVGAYPWPAQPDHDTDARPDPHTRSGRLWP